MGKFGIDARNVCLTCAFLAIFILSSRHYAVTHAEVSSGSPEGYVSIPTPTHTFSSTPTPPCRPVDCRGATIRSSYDVNNDCIVSMLDMQLLQDYLTGPLGNRSSNSSYDLNGDGVVNQTDLDTLRRVLEAGQCTSPTVTPLPTVTNTPTSALTSTPTQTPPLTPFLTATPVPTMTPTLRATNTPTQTPLPTNTPTPTVVITPPCVFELTYFNLNHSAYNWRDVARQEGFDRNQIFSKASPASSCLKSVVNGAFNQCPGNGRVGSLFACKGGGMSGWWREMCHGDPQQDDCVSAYLGARFSFANPYVFEQILYLDQNCNRIPSLPSSAVICERLYSAAAASPISLLLDENASITDYNTISEFPLDLRKDGYSIWRGSRSTPLIVFDPTHTGSITSADQLFGSWTFGGKDGTPQNNVSNNLTVLPWSDGFEPLGLLDNNQDGKLEGTELKDLGLWFDNNQNAVSDEGEVVALTSKVTSLKYGPTKESPDRSLVAVEEGFLLTDRKSEKYGKLIDWRSEVYPSRDKALAALKMQLATNALKDSRRKAPIDQQLSKQSDVEFSPTVNNFSGYWEWSLDNSDIKGVSEDKPFGQLIIRDSIDGVSGFSVSEFKVELRNQPESLKDAKSLMIINKFIGRKRIEHGTGKVALELKIIHSDDRVTESTVALDDKERQVPVLRGTSIETKDGTTLLAYDWIARPVQ